MDIQGFFSKTGRTAADSFSKSFAGSFRFLPAVVLSTLMFPGFAQAHGFLCTSVDLDTKIAVYFEPAEPNSDMGPRATKMIMLDPTVSPKRQLIAQFSAADGLLNNSSSVIVAYVDLNHPDSSRRGERVGGTTLGALSSIVLEIDFAYEEPANEGAQFSGHVVYLKKNGETLEQDFDCTRYSDFKSMRVGFTE